MIQEIQESSRIFINHFKFSPKFSLKQSLCYHWGRISSKFTAEMVKSGYFMVHTGDYILKAKKKM